MVQRSLAGSCPLKGKRHEEQICDRDRSTDARFNLSGCGRHRQRPRLEVPTPVVTPLSVATISPATGSTAGGASMKIIGTGFKPGVVAIFDGQRPWTFRGTDMFATIYLQTPPHAAGAVDVVVTNLDGGSVRVSSGHAYVSAGSFDPNGHWAGGAMTAQTEQWSSPFRTTCLSAPRVSGTGEKFPLALSSPSPVINGEFSFYRDDGIGMSARIVSASEIVGTMNFAACTAMVWRTYPRSQGASQ